MRKFYPVEFYVVGRVSGEGGEGAPWSLLGVFDDKCKAVIACDDDHCFVVPIVLNEVRPIDGEMAGCWYPLLEDGYV